jgi:GT2 family glycosyltransferase
MNKIDIIILSYAKDESLKKVTENAITSLLASEDGEQINFNILVIESNKSLKPFTFPRTETIYPDIEFNFNRYQNIGLKWSVSEYVCFCNNDLIFQPGWASAMLKAFDNDSLLMSASPVCPDFHPTIGLLPNTGNYYGYRVRHEIAGWCLFAKRSLFNTIGKFDEQFKFWFADADYAKTLQSKNQRHALITSSVVLHLDGISTKELNVKMKKAMTSEQFWYFQYKWEHRNILLYLYRKLRSRLRIMNINYL